MKLDALDPFPRLKTERLELRELRREDADDVFSIFADDEVTRFYDLATMRDRSTAEALIERLAKRHSDRTAIRWAIEKSGSVVGTIGFNSFVAWADRAVLGYDVARAWWSKGIATEAVRHVVEFGHDVLGLKRVEALVMLGNEASVRVLEKTGFCEEGVLRAYGHWKGAYHDLRMFSHVRS